MGNPSDSYDALLIDAGTGNLHSVHNAILALGYNVLLTDRPEDLARPGRVILPGVGAFGSFMEGLRGRGLAEPLAEAARRGDPLLGICVGMQALFEVGLEMGAHAGLGLLPGTVMHFPEFEELKVPHTGWNQLWFAGAPDAPSPIFNGLPAGTHVYFNHSFYCQNSEPSDTAARTDYGIEFTSAVQRDNLFGVQFHPEKSQRVGQKVLDNFFKI
jgi:imidazole glycerol-phosphate synthase subunit HisH